jgi:hypothetical protein
MPETYVVNPLSTEPPAPVKPIEEPEEARDCAFFCLTYIFCCLPVLLGWAR